MSECIYLVYKNRNINSFWIFFIISEFVCFSGTLKTIKLGVALPWSGGEWNVAPRFASGITVAVKDINKDPSLLNGYNVTFVWNNSKCNEKGALKAVVDMYILEKVNAIIGPACSDGCKLAAILAEHWNIPMVSYGCAASYLSQKKVYPNFARTVGDYGNSGRVIVKLMLHFNWKKISIITPASGVWMDIMNGVRKGIENIKDLELSYFQTFNEETVSDAFLQQSLLAAKKKSHIFLLGGYTSIIRRVMIEAKGLNMISQGYVFISYELLLDGCSNNYPTLVDINPDVCQALDGLLDISLYVPNDDNYKNFSQLVRMEIMNPPFSRKMLPSEQVEIYAALLYDAALLYARALNKTISMNQSIDDGRAIVNNMLNTRFKGASGDVIINDVGDRKSALQIRNINNGGYERVANYYSSSDHLEILQDKVIIWPGKVTTVPLGRPKCGFDKEFCASTGLWVPIVCGILACFLFMMLAIIFVLKRRQRSFESSLWLENWRIDFYDIKFGRKRSRFQSVFGSTCAIERTESKQTLHSDIGGNIGVFQGNYVAIKRVHKNSLPLTRDILYELKGVHEVQHQNINQFIGACVDPPNICILTKYCQKGSLKDVLFNPNIKLDWMFKMSFAVDIARGMHYLHNSIIGVHGNLTSSNCVIDGRWACKITDFGLMKFKGNQDVSLEDCNYDKMLWKAPEHIENKQFPYSQFGDVYSYGIIMQEIITRDLPFSMFTNLSLKEKVYLVKKRTKPVFRPIVNENLGTSDYQLLMRQCWEDWPESRPNFYEINKRLKLCGGKNISIVDNMMNMMEKYANQLEDLVFERTFLLEEEKAKTDNLLYSMLPKSVAEQLKLGKPVKAESFDMVTILFSDIVGFTKLASECTPFQVVDLLNGLYTCFDNICDTYSVYKVETIGDAYMVVSGLPDRTIDTHAGEIARMSLNLLFSTTTFCIPHLPETKVQIRIGIHSGPVVAGVVGLKMPRYCLFGDTVNYASRMESTGLALRVHVSPECKSLLLKLGGFHLVERGPVLLKGKGSVVTYFLAGYDGFDKNLPNLRYAASSEDQLIQ
ncbi:atrial natriuretic peptide receptor 2 isoform X2 [Hydra vulgaris]|uniref:Guanylate cyclase n=1 Tax=Hydra vulgaris TaxID=6087 RepID=A0ABM4BKV5_HYDVU